MNLPLVLVLYSSWNCCRNSDWFCCGFCDYPENQKSKCDRKRNYYTWNDDDIPWNYTDDFWCRAFKTSEIN